MMAFAVGLVGLGVIGSSVCAIVCDQIELDFYGLIRVCLKLKKKYKNAK